MKLINIRCRSLIIDRITNIDYITKDENGRFDIRENRIIELAHYVQYIKDWLIIMSEDWSKEIKRLILETSKNSVRKYVKRRQTSKYYWALFD